jgi:hypothetical protein
MLQAHIVPLLLTGKLSKSSLVQNHFGPLIGSPGLFAITEALGSS